MHYDDVMDMFGVDNWVSNWLLTVTLTVLITITLHYSKFASVIDYICIITCYYSKYPAEPSFLEAEFRHILLTKFDEKFDVYNM